MMFDMGAAITIPMKKWVDANGLAIKEKVAEYILGANGTSVKIVGTSNITLLLGPMLELDMSSVAIFLGDFYQGLLGCNLLCRHNKVLSVATISLPRPD